MMRVHTAGHDITCHVNYNTDQLQYDFVMQHFQMCSFGLITSYHVVPI